MPAPLPEPDMLLSLLRPPHEYLRRRLPQVRRLLASGALAALLGLWMHHNPAYPPYWDAALTLSVMLCGLWSPLLAFWLAGAASLYGVYPLSFYLAVLWLCALILGQRAGSRHLGAVALLLGTPFLGRAQLLWAAPLFGGLYLGSAGGAWLGVLSAAWAELLAALHGYAPDFLQFATHPWSLTLVQARFAGLNSWRTLSALLAPLAPNPTALLYHLLQIIAWGLAGALVGRWVQENPRDGRPLWVLLATLKGALFLAITQGGMSLWLGQHPRGWFTSQGVSLLPGVLIAPLAVTWLEVLRDFFQRPLPLPSVSSSAPSPAAVSPPVVVPDSSPESENGETNADESDLIMLELD